MSGSASTPLTSAALNRFKVSEMRATIWHHAKLAKGTVNAAGRCVNPNLIQGKPDLFAFIATHLKNDVFDAPTAEMMVTWNREGGDHALITALLESVNPRAGGQPAGNNQADDNKDERREGEQGDDGEGEEDEDDHDSREEQPLPALVKKLKEARPVQTRGARNQATATTVVRQAETAVMTRYTLCTNPECEEMFPFTISADLPNFCPKCGTNLRGGRQQGGTQTSATAPAVTPTVWARASSFLWPTPRSLPYLRRVVTWRTTAAATATAQQLPTTDVRPASHVATGTTATAIAPTAGSYTSASIAIQLDTRQHSVRLVYHSRAAHRLLPRQSTPDRPKVGGDAHLPSRCWQREWWDIG
jgi:hypothetical protein